MEWEVKAERLAQRKTRAGHGDVAKELRARTAPASLVVEEEGRLRCTACAHRCVFDRGVERVGSCGVRFVAGGELRVPFGYVARRYVRAVETNTVFHVRPGAKALTFGMYGCDLRCPYCHNGHVSQTWDAEGSLEQPFDVTPEAIVAEAVAAGCEVLCSAYNEPMITAEWAHAIFAEAKKRGLATVLVSDGHTTEEALRFMRDVTDVFRVDLKGWTAEQYKLVGGRLDAVLDGLRLARSLGYWVEVVSLIVPGMNDDAHGARAMAKTLFDIGGGDIPWHFDAFHPRFKMKDRARTDAGLLVSLAGIAYARGHRYVYVGNVPEATLELSHTRCPSCHAEVIRRGNWETIESRLVGGACPDCQTPIPGVFT